MPYNVDIAGIAGLPDGMHVQVTFDNPDVAAAVQSVINDGKRWQQLGGNDRERVVAAMNSSRSIQRDREFATSITPREAIGPDITWKGNP